MSALTILAAVGCGAMGGVFFAFSAFVMGALRRLPPAQGIAAMQSINVVAVTPLFMTALIGTAVACVAAIAVDGSPYVIGGAALYLLGAIAVTLAYNVPRNNALAAVEPGSPEAERLWTRYLAEWTAANHVRTVSGLGAAAALMVG
jgi:uncharacterized membrane protein